VAVFFSVGLMVRISVGCVMFGVMSMGFIMSFMVGITVTCVVVGVISVSFIVVSVAIVPMSMFMAWGEKTVASVVIGHVGESSILDITSENSLL